MSKIPAISIATMETDFAQLERRGVTYGYGVKAAPLGCDLSAIKSIDCSGYARYAVYRATGGALVLPDGSQMQRAWFEEKAKDPNSGVRKVNYRDAAAYMTERRLFICFIKPFANGCGDVGHVWFLSQFDDGNNGTKAGTMESHGGGGCISRPWSYPTLLREVYECFEVPTK